MKKLWWKIRYAYWFHRFAPFGIRFSIQVANEAEYDEDTSPKDSVCDELSYWMED